MANLTTFLTGTTQGNGMDNLLLDPNNLFIPGLSHPSNYLFQNQNISHLLPISGNLSGGLSLFTKPQNFSSPQSQLNFQKSDDGKIKKLRIRENKNNQEKIIEVIDLEADEPEKNLSPQKGANSIKSPILTQVPSKATKQTLQSLNQENPSQFNGLYSDLLVGAFYEIMERNYFHNLLQNLYLFSNLQTNRVNEVIEDWKANSSISQTINDETQFERGEAFWSPSAQQKNDLKNQTPISSNDELNKCDLNFKDQNIQENFTEIFQPLELQDKKQDNQEHKSLESPQACLQSDDFQRDEQNKTLKEMGENETTESNNEELIWYPIGNLDQSDKNEIEEEQQPKPQKEKKKRGRKPNSQKLKNLETNKQTHSSSETHEQSNNHKDITTHDESSEFYGTYPEGREEKDFPLPEGEVKLGENSEDGNTRVGTNYQAVLFPLGSRQETKRVPKLRWAPTMLDEEQREQYYSELASIVGKKEITNEAIALKTLTKNEMRFEKAYEEVRNNPTYFKGHFNPGTRILRSGRFY